MHIQNTCLKTSIGNIKKVFILFLSVYSGFCGAKKLFDPANDFLECELATIHQDASAIDA